MLQRDQEEARNRLEEEALLNLEFQAQARMQEMKVAVARAHATMFVQAPRQAANTLVLCITLPHRRSAMQSWPLKLMIEIWKLASRQQSWTSASWRSVQASHRGVG